MCGLDFVSRVTAFCVTDEGRARDEQQHPTPAQGSVTKVSYADEPPMLITMRSKLSAMKYRDATIG